MESNGITYKSDGGRSAPSTTTTTSTTPTTTEDEPTKALPPVNYHMLSKMEIARQITNVHKVYLKYTLARTKAELIQILEQLDNGVVPDKIEALW